jgi:transcriptional regulator with XRE-family HTH domain
MGEDVDIVALGQVIARRRKAINLTVERLASRAGTAAPYLRRLEAGQGKRIGVEVLVRVARALGTTVDDLLSDIGVDTGKGARSEVDAVYLRLGPAERRALVEIARVLGTMRATNDALRAGQPDGEEAPSKGLAWEPIAAYDRDIPDTE